ncbi:MAG: hypothetical protein B6I31_02140 [Desulfobacteraceae bacterium 4572_19]|nr:MAG: hypothetical protein B6I31_02140 [Desulfobacteraceae bacterium 4572_19]
MAKYKDFIMEKEKLMLLFNGLFDFEQKTELQVTVPLLGNLVLFTIKSGGDKVHFINFIKNDHYYNYKNPIVRNMETKYFARELPEYNDIINALFQSDILKMQGIKPFMKLIDSIRLQDVTMGGDVYYIALDTNLLRDRFFSTTIKRLPYHPNIDYVLCSTVRDEMMNRLDKITQNNISKMKPIDSHLLRDCFFNQNPLEDRLRNIGFQEYNKMRSETSCEEINAPAFKSSTKNDQVILKTYSEFVEMEKKVIFLSRDNETVRMMKGENNVIPFLIEQYPVKKDYFSTSWNNCFEFLYILGILFGSLHINHPSGLIITLQSVWHKKDAEEWEKELVKVKIKIDNNENSNQLKNDYCNTLHRCLTRNLSILKLLH